MFGNDEVPDGMSGWSILHAMTAQIPIDPADADSTECHCAVRLTFVFRIGL